MITATEWEAFLDDLQQTLDKFAVPPAEQAEINAIVASTRADTSCIIAIADAQATLLAGRTLQGLAAAFAVPCTLAAVDSGASPERRAEVVGAWTGFLMLGFSIGPLLGGALTHITGWRVIFWLNALLMLVAFAGMASAGSATMRADGTRGRRVDWVGFILLATFMVALIFGLHEVPDSGVAPLPLVGALLLAAAHASHQNRLVFWADAL